MVTEITQLVNNIQEPGFRSIKWDETNDLGQPVSSEMYLYQIKAGYFIETKKMILIK